MKNPVLRLNFLALSLVVLSMLNSACSSFGGKSELEDPGFRKRAANGNQAVPLPVEIAKDIERISEDGLLVYSDNPSYSGAFSRFSRQVANQQQNQSSTYPEIQDCSKFTDEDHKNCLMRNEQIVKLLAQENGDSTESSLEENHLSSEVKSKAQSENVLTEDDLLLKEETGPLALSLKKKKNGPLNFRSKISGSGLEPLTGGKTVSYVVRLGDTLMKIAFEKYANYLRWKDIYKVNKNKMSSPERMQVGTELTIKNVKYVYIKRDGKPYLIRKMDTLKSISQKLYGTPDRWEEIWKNNPQLVRNPKKIYAGFTLYYQEPNKVDGVEMREPTSSSNSSSGAGPLRSPKSLKSKENVLPKVLPKKSKDLF